MNLLDLITLSVAGFNALIVSVMLVNAYVFRHPSNIKGIPACLLFGLGYLVVADLIVKAAS